MEGPRNQFQEQPLFNNQRDPPLRPNQNQRQYMIDHNQNGRGYEHAQAHYDHGRGENRQHNMYDHMNPIRAVAQSCIVLPPQSQWFVVRPNLLPLLPQFHGLESEKPFLHVKDFEEVVSTMLDPHTDETMAFLKLFPF